MTSLDRFFNMDIILSMRIIIRDHLTISLRDNHCFVCIQQMGEDPRCIMAFKEFHRLALLP